jgi:predicted 2-oxoglutarate/Fe(II)-dependent dioxygenase YbiX
MGMLSIKTKEIHKTHGFPLLTGLVDSCGTIFNVQTVRTSCMTCGVLMENQCSIPRYQEGQFYGWHNDAGLATQYKPVSVGNRVEGLGQDFVNENIEQVRKLSFVMQLSDPDDYEGGNLQLLDEAGNSYIAPRQRGTVILFDSRTQHRVLKVTKGTRKSIVGWTVGPRWK